ncbi:MAG: (Fe-S)-binding protein [bacterium]
MPHSSQWIEIALRENEISKCVHCGLCQAVCPTYLVERHEGKNARGKIVLLKGLLSGELKPNAYLADWFDDCLTCYACQSVCPSGVQTSRLWTAARQDLASVATHTSRKRLILRWTLGKPRLFRSLLRIGSLVNGINPHFHFLARLDHGRIPISRKAPYQHKVQKIYEPPDGTPLGSVGLVIGCLGDISLPWAVDGAISLLVKSGWRVILPKPQGCCGAPAINNGDWELARSLAIRLAKLFSKWDWDFVTSPDATCTSTIRHDWQEIFLSQGGAREGVKKLSSKVRGLWELVETGIKAGRLEFKDTHTRVALHHSCHSFHLPPANRWEVVLRKIPGLEIVPMEDEHLCCGFGGSYAKYYPEQSYRIAQRKIRKAKESGAEIMLVGSPGCLIRLNGVDEGSIPVEYIAHFLAERAQSAQKLHHST